MSYFISLKERINAYEENSSYKLIRKLPVIIVINGRSFRKATSLLPKPYSIDFVEIMCATMLKLASEIDGTIFVYSFNDEIIVISRNDQSIDTNIWYDGKIQKIISSAASIATLEFNKRVIANDINIIGDPIFNANTFVVPNITEAINTLIYKQQQAFQTSISMAVFYELLKKYDLEKVKDILFQKTFEEKIDILSENNIEFNNYPIPFKRGIGCYRIPKVIKQSNNEEIIKNKLIIDMELPIFTKEPQFLNNIFTGGMDIFRARRDV